MAHRGSRFTRLTRLTLRSALALALASTSLACGGEDLHSRSAKHPKGGAAQANPFPSRDALDKVAQSPLRPPPARDVAPASEWKVDAALPDLPPPVETHFAKVATKANMGLSYAKELRCVAREVGRFHLEHSAYPDERLKRFMIAACGLTDPAIALGEQHAEVPKETTDEQLLTQWQSKLTIPTEYRGNATGIWMGRKGKRLEIMIASAKPQGEVVVSPTDASGQVLVHGTVPPGSEMVLGLVNQGEHGVARCEPDLATPLPLFALRCSMAEGDQTAWIEIAARAQGRLLLRPFALTLARRDASLPFLYSAPSHAAKPATTSNELSTAVLEGVNRARVASKLAPVTLAPTQTTTNERLAPHFFQAAVASDQEKGDIVGLGLLAGWDVEGTIRNGNLFAALLSGTTDANGWREYALEMPMGRFTMLDAGARQIAIGFAPEAAVGGIGAVVTTYEFFGGNDHRPDVARVFDRIARLRVARGLAQPVAIQGMKGVGAQAMLVNAGKKDAEEALNDGLVAERDRLHRSVRGWVIQTNDLDSIPLPPQMVAAGPLSVGVEITHVRPQGAAWGSYIVFLVMEASDAAPSPQITASTRAEANAL